MIFLEQRRPKPAIKRTASPERRVLICGLLGIVLNGVCTEPAAQPRSDIAVLEWTGRNAPVVGAVDGKPVSRNTKRIELEPGEHRIELVNVAVSSRKGQSPQVHSIYPLSVAVTAGHTYELKQAWDDFGYDFKINNVWIEDKASGEVVAGRSSPSTTLSSAAVHMTQWRSLCKNAVKGDGEARAGIAAHFRNGWPPARQDPILASAWYRLAEEAGNPRAAEHRQAVEERLKPHEVLQAGQIAAHWRPDEAECVKGAASK